MTNVTLIRRRAGQGTVKNAVDLYCLYYNYSVVGGFVLPLLCCW